MTGLSARAPHGLASTLEPMGDSVIQPRFRSELSDSGCLSSSSEPLELGGRVQRRMTPTAIVHDRRLTAPVNSPEEAGPSFMVVAMVREEPSIIMRFIEFYLRSGADQIVIYFDGILSDRGNILRPDQPRVQIIECTTEFWRANCDGRPESLEGAQIIIYSIAHSRCRCDWLLIVDSDEFVVGPRSIRSLLSSVPDGIDSVRLRTAEAVWGPGDDVYAEFGSSYFRTALPRRGARLLSRILYGKYAPLFRFGMLGHTAGKHFLRRKARIDQIGIHLSRLRGQPIGAWAHELSPKNLQFMVAHFDAISFDRWREKWRRRLVNETIAEGMSIQRVIQMKLIKEATVSGEDSLRKTFRIFNSINRWQCLILALLGMVVRTDIFNSSPRPPPGPRAAD
jgi:hypothetical protein